MGKRGKKATAEPKARLIRKIPAESPEARDEGPRLLQLPSAAPSDSLTHHARYLELADVALNPKKK